MKNLFGNRYVGWCCAALFIAVQIPLAQAAINWPSTQILPSFSATAQNQDLIYLNSAVFGDMTRWEAESTSLGHNTGHLDGDGWLCQTGVDSPNNHMVYGPYANNLVAGSYTAEFRMKIDNNTANNDPQVDIDVRNATTGAILASQTVTRQQFSVASNYVSFRLDFTMPANNQSLELRVYWRGNAYIKVDWVGVQANNTSAEQYLFSSLKGIVNRTQPRIFSYDGDAFAEGPYTWMQSLGLTWTEYPNKWDLITKYRSEIGGVIVYDPAQLDTVNLATAMAKDKKAIIASPTLLARLTAAPYNLPVLADLRGQFTSKLQVYQALYNNYWAGIDHRLLIGLSPQLHQGSLREYATALGAATIWLDPQVSGESELLNSFLGSMQPGSIYMGWWPQEGPGIDRASTFGISTVASDYATNLTVHGGMPRTINVKPIPAKPALQNKIYVAFILSDGDNLQYVEHLMRKLWSNPDRGSVPIGWTVSPAMVDAMPGALNYLWQTATNNDVLISGPSGYGYTFPNNWPNDTQLAQFVAKSEDYNRQAGLRVITVWNGINGGIDPRVGNIYANAAPSLLGVTGQNTAGPLSIYNNVLPGFPLSCNYCDQENNVKDFINSAVAGWNRAEPRFVVIQANPWHDMKPTNFKNVANSLNADYVVVRPDHLFQLLRESKGLPTNPQSLVQVYQHCNYDGWVASFGAGSFNASNITNAGGIVRDASSLHIAPGYKATLYPDDNFGGTPIELTGDVSCLVGQNFDNKLSSIKISPIASIPAGYTLCASENQTCSFSGSASVAYGANGVFNYRTATGSIACNNSTFGDPIPGVAKSCYYLPTTTFSKQIEAEAYSSMSGVQTEATTDVGGGSNVGWIDANDWMAYANINFPTSGSYKVEYRVASPSGSTLSLDLNAGAIQLGQLAIPATGGWQSWTTVSHTVNITAGTYSVGVFAPQGGWNFNWIRFTKL